MGDAQLTDYAQVVEEGHALSATDAAEAAQLLIPDEISAEEKQRFLAALAAKGETAEEVAAFASVFREQARDPGLQDFAGRAIDIVGTGGDGVGSFNISTATAFVVAAAGVPVIKHGNRSITSKCGSANLLEALGFDLEAEAATLRQSLAELNFCFLFAPAYHPAFKAIVPVRKALAAEGKRTIFNLLGPLINPGKPAFELMGVFGAAWVKPLADALTKLQLEAAAVVHCQLPDGRGMDELSCAGENLIEAGGKRVGEAIDLSSEATGLAPCTLDELLGGDGEENLRLLHELAKGKAPGGLHRSICLNAGLALWLAQKASSPREGIAEANEVIQSGALRNWLSRTQAFHQA